MRLTDRRATTGAARPDVRGPHRSLRTCTKHSCVDARSQENFGLTATYKWHKLRGELRSPLPAATCAATAQTLASNATGVPPAVAMYAERARLVHARLHSAPPRRGLHVEGPSSSPLPSSRADLRIPGQLPAEPEVRRRLRPIDARRAACTLHGGFGVMYVEPALATEQDAPLIV